MLMKRDNIIKTNICEETHSKNTIASIILKLKPLLNKPIFIVENGKVKKDFFSNITNKNGCIILENGDIKGKSLLDQILTAKEDVTFLKNKKDVFELILNILNAFKIVHKETGKYPHFYLNGIFYDSNSKSVTFLPEDVSSLLHDYLPENLKNINGFCIKSTIKSFPDSESELIEYVAFLLYLIFNIISGKSDVKRYPIYDLRDIVPEINPELSKCLWKIMRREKKVSLEYFKNLIELSKNYKKTTKTPLLKRKKLIDFTFKTKIFLQHRWKFLIIITIIAGVFLYTIGDIIYKSTLSKITENLTPKQVIELYIEAIKNLDVETINQIFYRRAGKTVFKEVSTLFVIKRMTQAYGIKWLDSSQIKDLDLKHLPDNVRIYAINNVRIKEIDSSKKPLFTVEYTKIISSEDSIDIYHFKEWLSLIKIKNRWYIGKYTRKLLDHKEIKI